MEVSEVLEEVVPVEVSSEEVEVVSKGVPLLLGSENLCSLLRSRIGPLAPPAVKELAILHG